ncbi:MAG: bifunctional metallophosphatase/5'-nucleotidase [Clostridia bacterium]|nr:bifunctional metallophosphatase/5'-nucleotidase [Clostridia bacterium]
MKSFKKIICSVLLISMLTVGVFGMTSCLGITGTDGCKHEWGQWGIVKSEDCNNPGFRVRMCNICSEKESESIPAAHRFVNGVCARCEAVECTSHNFGTWSTVKNASCEENGLRERSCSICGEKEKEAIPAAHSYVDGVCSSCGKSECAAHVFGGWTVTLKTTCTQNGKKERSCTVCGEVEREILYTTGHEYEGGKCTVCGNPEPAGALDANCAHTDSNSDKYCDGCGGYTVVVIDIYAINDLHGKIFDTDSQPGVDELTTYIKSAYTTDDNVIVLSSGDMWQGTSESNLTHGNMMTEWLGELGTVSMTFGNHEFDWNNSYIYDNIALASFPFLAINIYDTTTGTRAAYATPSVIVERGGAKIGIIGAIGDCHSSISQDKVADVEFKIDNALTALVKAESERLRALGCDMIVYSIHDGLDSGEGSGQVSDSTFRRYYDTALSDGYVDVVFEAHSHQRYVCTDRYGVYHLQGGGENSGISHVELSLDVVTDDVNVGTAETVRSYVYSGYSSDDIVDELREKYKNEIAKGDELLGYTQSYVAGDVLRQACADSYLKYGLEIWADKYNIVLGGGYIGIRSPYDLSAGDVYYKDIYSLFPFDNALCLCSVSGKKLKSQFINSTNSNYFIAMSDYGKGLSISDSATYYIVTDTYSAFYAPNGLTIVDMLDEEFYARDMLAEYVKEGGLGKKPEAPDISEIDIKSVAEIKEIIDGLGVGVESTSEYYVLVTITDTPNSTYGNCNVMDSTGTIYVYGLKDSTGSSRYDALAVKPKKGDTVLLLGKVLLYYDRNTGETKYEIKNAKIIEINPE